MKKIQFIGKIFLAGFVFGIGILAAFFIIVRWYDANTLEVTSTDTLSTGLRNEMVSRLYWKWSGNDINYEWGKVQQEGFDMRSYIGEVTQTAYMSMSGTTWVDIPWVSMNFTLPRDMTVRFHADGTVMGIDGTDKFTYCGFRLVVDGTEYGDADFGDRVVWVWNNAYAPAADQVPRASYWALHRDINLTAGAHSVKLQLISRHNSDVQCYTTSNHPHATKLYIQAK